jgi:hypothetical protein
VALVEGTNAFSPSPGCALSPIALPPLVPVLILAINMLSWAWFTGIPTAALMMCSQDIQETAMCAHDCQRRRLTQRRRNSLVERGSPQLALLARSPSPPSAGSRRTWLSCSYPWAQRRCTSPHPSRRGSKHRSSSQGPQTHQGRRPPYLKWTSFLDREALWIDEVKRCVSQAGTPLPVARLLPSPELPLDPS